MDIGLEARRGSSIRLQQMGLRQTFSVVVRRRVCKGHTFNGAFECDDKLLQTIVHEAHIVV